ncbi:MBL fold metallo-hydrolase, partial [Candidatus Saccharibacteria bacterium]|nr:MBL fold metallo-hydrolase [Candidatus Saccharibacteria bacterium]
MELEFFGGNCFRIKTKSTTLVVDDNLSKLGKKSIQSDKTVAFYTSNNVFDERAAAQSRLSFVTPGEFEVGDVTVNGVQARGHMDEEGKLTANVFQFMHGGQTISVLGHVHPDISDEVVELISGTDVLVVPVGGNGFTLDPVGAASIIKKTEPNVVV